MKEKEEKEKRKYSPALVEDNISKSPELKLDDESEVKSLFIAGPSKSSNVTPVYNDFMNDVFAPKRH